MAVHGHWNSWGAGLCAEEHQRTRSCSFFDIYYIIHFVCFNNLQNREKEFKLREADKDEDQALLSVSEEENKSQVKKSYWK